MLMKQSGSVALQALSEAVGLRPWLLEAVIVEHFACRRIQVDEPAITLDYALIDAAHVQQLMKPIVLLNAPLLLHNLTADTARYRLFLGMAALFGARIFPVATLAEQPYMYIPDGKVSPHHLLFPRQEDQPDEDEKLGLNIFGYTLVLDDDGLYQWQIAQDAASLTTYRSEIILPEWVSELTRTRAALDALPFSDDSATRSQRQQDIEALYADLDHVRSAMRAAVLSHHEAHKGTAEAIRGYTEQQPPELTLVDQFVVRGGAIKVRTFIEPLFFRAAHRAALRAVAAKDLVLSGTHVSIYIAEEIEASAEAITLSVMCLEAYINGFARDHLPQLNDLLQILDLKAKWRLFPGMLGHPDCFIKDRMPYQAFSELVRWRNHVLVHYKHEFEAPELLTGRHHKATSVHHICNADNAQRAIQTVVEMVRHVATGCELEPPDWVRESVLTGGWLRAEGLTAMEHRPRTSDEVTLPKLRLRATVQPAPDSVQES